MEHEIVNKETPEMKQLISGIKEVSKRIREIGQTHRPLFGGGESTSRGEKSANGFSSALVPCKTIATKTLFPTPKLRKKSSITSQTSTDCSKRIIEMKHSQEAFSYRSIRLSRYK